MYDIVLREKEYDNGLTKEDVLDLFDMLNEGNAYPVEIEGTISSCAMGFITPDMAEALNFDYEKSGLNAFVASILDDMEKEREDCSYEFKGFKIWLSR